MSVIVSKDESRTIIVTTDKRYVITQSPDKEIKLSVEHMYPTDRLSYELGIILTIPAGIKTLTIDTSAENTPEIFIWPIPLKVMVDIQERTNGDIRVEDVSEYNKKVEHGEEFFIRIKGYILITTI